MDILLQVVVSGLAAGGVYGLIALGFVLIYKATSILNLATGAFMFLGAFAGGKKRSSNTKTHLLFTIIPSIRKYSNDLLTFHTNRVFILFESRL